jgi:hypothetical protein
LTDTIFIVLFFVLLFAASCRTFVSAFPIASSSTLGSIIMSAPAAACVPSRIEKAFQLAKERNEAAFVTFITAGYPTAAGTS